MSSQRATTTTATTTQLEILTRSGFMALLRSGLVSEVR